MRVVKPLRFGKESTTCKSRTWVGHSIPTQLASTHEERAAGAVVHLGLLLKSDMSDVRMASLCTFVRFLVAQGLCFANRY